MSDFNKDGKKAAAMPPELDFRLGGQFNEEYAAQLNQRMLKEIKAAQSQIADSPFRNPPKIIPTKAIEGRRTSVVVAIDDGDGLLVLDTSPRIGSDNYILTQVKGRVMSSESQVNSVELDFEVIEKLYEAVCAERVKREMTPKAAPSTQGAGSNGG